MAAGFTLESLASDEEREYRAHLEACYICRQLVGEFQTFTDMLPEALDEGPVQPGVKARLLQQASVELELETARAVERAPASREAYPHRRWRTWLSPVPMTTLAALLLVIVGLVAWNIALQVSSEDGEGMSQEQRLLVEVIAGGASLISLSGTEAAPESSGSLVLATGSDNAFLILRNLPNIPIDREFQVWRITGDVPTASGTFSPIINGSVRQVNLHADFSGADAIGVSIEPAGGSLAPTGDIVLLGAP